jgi:hypothetical protein
MLFTKIPVDYLRFLEGFMEEHISKLGLKCLNFCTLNMYQHYQQENDSGNSRGIMSAEIL